METEDLMKLILGALLVVALITGIALFFKDQVIGFFKGLTLGKPEAIFLMMIK